MSWTTLKNSCQSWWNYRPLHVIIIGAIFVRVWAAFASPGYLMIDDHFLTVEVAGSWAVGENNGNWIPGWGNQDKVVEGFSFLYPGVSFAFYKTMHTLGFHDPQFQQLIFRILHGLWSVLTVFYVFKLAERLGNKKVAVTAGLLMAFLGVMPLYAVRNLVELFGHPFIIGGLYYLSFPERKKWMLGALFLGLAVGVRYQNAWIPIGWGIAYFLLGQWKRVISVACIAFAAFFMTQIDDVLLWGGKPFQHVYGYLHYNATHSGNYPGSPFTYFGWIGYFILPPVSLFLLWGAVSPLFRGKWKVTVNHPMVYGLLGAFFMFTVFHIVFPNRQERFLFPILPVFIVLGSWGWNQWVESRGLQQHKGIANGWKFFWTLNTLFLIVASNIYPKKSRVESMYALYQYGDAKNFVQDYAHKDSNPLAPKYYAGLWSEYYTFSNQDNLDELVRVFDDVDRNTANEVHHRLYPNYVLFYQDVNLEQRVAVWKKYYPHLTYCTTIEPSYFDIIMQKINPVNSLENVTIYRIPAEDIKDF
jgi:hypothetical protein